MENYILNPNSNFANSHSGICFLWMCLFKWDRVLFLGSIEPVDIAWKQVLHVAYLSFISGGWKWFQMALLREDLPPEMMDKKIQVKKLSKKGAIFRSILYIFGTFKFLFLKSSHSWMKTVQFYYWNFENYQSHWFFNLGLEAYNSNSEGCFLSRCLFIGANVRLFGLLEPVDIAWQHVRHWAYLSLISGGSK